MSERKFTININEVDEDGNETPRYMQTVDDMDIHAVIGAVNSASQSQPQRQRALRSDAGKSRPKKEELELPPGRETLASDLPGSY